MNDIDARLTVSKTRCTVEPVSEKGRAWMQENVDPMGAAPKDSYRFGHYWGGRVHQDMLAAGMTLHVIEVHHHHD